MNRNKPLTILCIASYEKGADFMLECKNQGCKVVLLTSKSLEFSDYWPKESIDEIFFIPDINKEWILDDVIYGVSFMARKVDIDKIAALDDFDVEKAATLREHLRISGMGDSTARYFRDKLAMRMKARDEGVLVPDFVHILNYQKIKEFISKVSPPYVLKPRLQAGAIGIKKVYNEDELWKLIDQLGDKQSFYLLEKFLPGNIYHVDSIAYNGKILWAVASQYGLPPMEVAHQGRVFSSRTMVYGSKDEQDLLKINNSVLTTKKLLQGISHSEYIKADEDGKFYFLETSARVGGANLAELVEAATGVNLWKEWAKIEVNVNYQLPKIKKEYAGILTSLAKQEFPDLSSFNEPEIYWKLKKKYHAGLIVNSPSYERVEQLIKDYTNRFYNDFFTFHPLPDKATS